MSIKYSGALRNGSLNTLSESGAQSSRAPGGLQGLQLLLDLLPPQHLVLQGLLEVEDARLQLRDLAQTAPVVLVGLV